MKGRALDVVKVEYTGRRFPALLIFNRPSGFVAFTMAGETDVTPIVVDFDLHFTTWQTTAESNYYP